MQFCFFPLPAIWEALAGGLILLKGSSSFPPLKCCSYGIVHVTLASNSNITWSSHKAPLNNCIKKLEKA